MLLFLQALLAQAPDVPAFSVADAVKAIQGGQSQANYLLLAGGALMLVNLVLRVLLLRGDWRHVTDPRMKAALRLAPTLVALIGTAGFGLTTGQPQPELIACLINALLAGLTSVGLWEMLGKPVANRIPEKPQE